MLDGRRGERKKEVLVTRIGRQALCPSVLHYLDVVVASVSHLAERHLAFVCERTRHATLREGAVVYARACVIK